MEISDGGRGSWTPRINNPQEPVKTETKPDTKTEPWKGPPYKLPEEKKPEPRFNPYRSDLFETKPAPKPAPKPVTPQDRLESARERRLDSFERGAPVKAVPKAPTGVNGPNIDATFGTPGKVRKNTDPIPVSGELTIQDQRTVKVSEKAQPNGLSSTVTFEVSQEQKGEKAKGVELGPYGVKHKSFESQVLNYEFSVPASQAEKYRADPANVPDLADPSSLPVGSSVVIRQEELKGTGFEFSATALEFSAERAKGAKLPTLAPATEQDPKNAWKVGVGPRFEAGSADVTGRSVAVEKLSDTKVRLTAGPTEGVKHEMGAGLFVGDNRGVFEASAKLGNTRSLTNGEYRSVTVDLSQPSGKAIYQHFLATGQVPPTHGKAVVDQTAVYQSRYTNSTEAELGLKALGLGGKVTVGLKDYSVDQRLTVQGDNKSLLEMTVADQNRTLQLDQRFDEKGEPMANTLVGRHVVHETEPETARMLHSTFKPAEPEAFISSKDPANVEITLTEQEALKLRDMARAYEKDNDAYSDGDEYLPDNDIPPVVHALALAETPAQVNFALMEAGGNNNALYDLQKLSAHHGQPLPGTVTVRSEGITATLFDAAQAVKAQVTQQPSK